MKFRMNLESVWHPALGIVGAARKCCSEERSKATNGGMKAKAGTTESPAGCDSRQQRPNYKKFYHPIARSHKGIAFRKL